MFPLE